MNEQKEFKEPRQLQEGYMSNEELAEWFGCTTKSMLHNKKRWLKRLSEYCKYCSTRGGVNISEIQFEYYVKNKNYQLVKDNFSTYWKDRQLNTAVNVGTQITIDNFEKVTVLPETMIRYVTQERKVRYGKPFGAPGKKGFCEYVWCTKDEEGQPIYLTDEQEKIKKQLLQEYFGGADEKTAMVRALIQEGELTEEEAWQYYDRIANITGSFQDFIFAFKQKTGYQLIRGTVIQDMIWFSEEEKPKDKN